MRPFFMPKFLFTSLQVGGNSEEIAMYRVTFTSTMPNSPAIEYYMDYASKGLAERAKQQWLRRFPSDTAEIRKIS